MHGRNGITYIEREIGKVCCDIAEAISVTAIRVYVTPNTQSNVFSFFFSRLFDRQNKNVQYIQNHTYVSEHMTCWIPREIMHNPFMVFGSAPLLILLYFTMDIQSNDM